MTCYRADFTGIIQSNSEIEEVSWYEEGMKCSAVTQIIIDWLKTQDLLCSTPTAPKSLEVTADAEQLQISVLPRETASYQWVLFDADETLFRFDDFRGLKRMFSAFGVEFNEAHYKDYKTLNHQLWVDYQNQKITIQQLKQERFHSWSERLNCSADDLNSAFLRAMSEICEPLDGAIDLLNHLRGQVKLGIITNGFTEWQQMRLERLCLSGHFDLLVTSEEAGVAKPNRVIFDYAFSRMGAVSPEQVLMVGDNLLSDIQGGISAGFHTCWFNEHQKAGIQHITPNYQITALSQLRHFIQRGARSFS